MKNSSRGFIVPLLLIVIAVLLVGGGAYVYQNHTLISVDSLPIATTTTQATPKPVQNTPTGTPSKVSDLPSSCANGTSADGEALPPVITSIYPKSGPIGTEVTIQGCNLSGFENDHNVVFERSDGSMIPLYGGSIGPNTITKVVLTSYCESGMVVGLYSGKETPCKKVSATPGAYKVYVNPWGKKSNTASFTVTSEPELKVMNVSPQANARVNAAQPIVVTGRARNVFNEGEFTISAWYFLDGKRKQITNTFASCGNENGCDWMSGNYVDFKSILNLSSSPVCSVTLEFHGNQQKENSPPQLPFYSMPLSLYGNGNCK